MNNQKTKVIIFDKEGFCRLLTNPEDSILVEEQEQGNIIIINPELPTAVSLDYLKLDDTKTKIIEMTEEEKIERTKLLREELPPPPKKIEEKIVYVTKEVPIESIREIVTQVEVIKEVPIEVIKEIPVEIIKEKIVYVTKEIPITVEKIITNEKIIDRIPLWSVLVLGLETITIIVLLLTK